METDLAAPRLAPPGAGLPKPELLVARLLFGLRRLTGSRESFNARFARERAALRALYVPCGAAAGARRVLIPRLRGLEDSSRHWSVWMTLDHLRIVNHAVAGTITLLGRSLVPPGTASTAAVKPAPDVTAAVAEEYEASCDALLAAVAAVPELRTAVRHAHPWFGPLDAHGWHALAALHLGIHRAQLERIRAGLGADR
jgi:hypothetical protein